MPGQDLLLGREQLRGIRRTGTAARARPRVPDQRRRAIVDQHRPLIDAADALRRTSGMRRSPIRRTLPSAATSSRRKPPARSAAATPSDGSSLPSLTMNGDIRRAGPSSSRVEEVVAERGGRVGQLWNGASTSGRGSASGRRRDTASRVHVAACVVLLAAPASPSYTASASMTTLPDSCTAVRQRAVALRSRSTRRSDRRRRRSTTLSRSVQADVDGDDLRRRRGAGSRSTRPKATRGHGQRAEDGVLQLADAGSLTSTRTMSLLTDFGIGGQAHAPVVGGQLVAVEQVGRRGEPEHDDGRQRAETETGQQLTKHGSSLPQSISPATSPPQAHQALGAGTRR